MTHSAQSLRAFLLPMVPRALAGVYRVAFAAHGLIAATRQRWALRLRIATGERWEPLRADLDRVAGALKSVERRFQRIEDGRDGA